MTEQLNDCLIVHANSIFTKAFEVNGFGSDIPLWSENASDWILPKIIPSLWIKKAPFQSGQKQNVTGIIITVNQ